VLGDERCGEAVSDDTLGCPASAVRGAFIRRLLTGPFRRTTDIDYCDPGDGG
jgi:hypothetical protein